MTLSKKRPHFMIKSWLRFWIYNRPIVAYRVMLETLQYLFPPSIPSDPNLLKVIYMTGIPRTGSSLLKNYLGDAPGLTILRFQKTGFFNAWRKAKNSDSIIIDKATHYIWNVRKIYKTYGDSIGFCCVTRDPRDVLLSLIDSGLHLEVPRDSRFWNVWHRAYGGFLQFCAEYCPQRAYLLRYEDMVRYPAKAKLHFLHWLGFDMPEITTTYKVAHEDDIQDFKLQAKKGIDTSSVEKYKHQEISPPIRELLQSLSEYPQVVALMRRLGYSLDGVLDDIEAFIGVQVFALDAWRTRVSKGSDERSRKL